MTARDKLRSLLARILPWPLRRQRKADIAAARAARDAAVARLADAAEVGRDIERIAYQDNHFARNTMRAFRGHPEPR